MTGFIYTLPGKSHFAFKLLAGYNICTLAGYSLTKTENPPTRTPVTWTAAESLQPSRSTSLAFDFGMSIMFLQKQHFLGFLNSDFIYSQAYFNSIYNTTGPYTYTDLNGLNHYRVTYNLLNFTIGIGYKI